MKKMLTMLFLLFCLSISDISVVNSYETDSEAMRLAHNKVETYDKYLVYKEGDEVRDAYHRWDGLPIFSPLKIRDINYISSDYGYRFHPIFHRRLMHDGIDFATKIGTTVYSTAEGRVVKVKRSRIGYGNEVIIRHRNGYCTRYAHLDSIFVKEGQIVFTTTQLGLVGSTGFSTGPHLHYEILHNNRPIDPMYFTYGTTGKRRSGQNYFNTLIALERQQAVDERIKLGLQPIRYAANVQVISSSKIN